VAVLIKTPLTLLSWRPMKTHKRGLLHCGSQRRHGNKASSWRTKPQRSDSLPSFIFQTSTK